MTLAMADRGSARLAAPTDSVALPPASLREARKAALNFFIDESAETLDVGWLAQARDLVDSHPDSPTAYARLAHAELIAGNESDAVRAAQSALMITSRKPDQPATSAALQVAIACHDLDTVQKHIAQLDPSGPTATLFANAALLEGDEDAALDYLSHSEDAPALALRAWVLLQKNAYQQAARDLRAALKLAGPTPELLINLGYAYAGLGSNAKAIKTTIQATLLSPRSQTAAFNLVSYYLHVGMFDKALDEVARLAAALPGDLHVALARANVQAAAGDPEAALTGLKKVRASDRSDPGDAERAEVSANIAYLEFRIGKRERHSTLEVLRRELMRCGYRSVGIARLLAAVTTKVSEAAQLETVIKGLTQARPNDKLIGIRAQLAFLRCDFDAAIDLCRDWRFDEPFNPDPVQLETFLLADFRADYSGSAAVGLDFLRRVPQAWMVANNVAYALARDGQPERAKAVLQPRESNAYVRATQALIDAAFGYRELACKGYAEAATIALRDGDSDLAILLALRAYLALDDQTLIGEVSIENLDSDEPKHVLMKGEARRKNIRWPFQNRDD